MNRRILVKTLLPAALLIAVGGSYASAAQPRMEAALADLQSARSELQAALADKAGHRVAAIALVDQAIGEVQAGMAASANQ